MFWDGVVDCGNIVEALTTNEFGCECWWRVACYVVAGHQHCTGSLKKRALAKQRFLHKVLCLFVLLCVILFLRRLYSQRLCDWSYLVGKLWVLMWMQIFTMGEGINITYSIRWQQNCIPSWHVTREKRIYSWQVTREKRKISSTWISFIVIHTRGYRKIRHEEHLNLKKHINININ